MHVIFLDLANAFGTVPQSLISKAFDYFRVPIVVINFVRAYVQDIRLCLSTAGFTTG